VITLHVQSVGHALGVREGGGIQKDHPVVSMAVGRIREPLQAVRLDLQVLIAVEAIESEIAPSPFQVAGG
jgi:hypothetical protein